MVYSHTVASRVKYESIVSMNHYLYVIWLKIPVTETEYFINLETTLVMTWIIYTTIFIIKLLVT